MPGDVYRTADCRYVNHSAIGVNISPVHKAAHYSGLVTCGSIWPCPVCASRIQERRRPEVQQAIDWGQAGRATRSLWSRSPSAQVSWAEPGRSAGAPSGCIRGGLRKGRPWDTMKADRGFKGLIRSLEVTHGANGWHPHTHELWFLKGSAEGFAKPLAGLWVKACEKAGLIAVNDESWWTPSCSTVWT